VRVDRVPGLGPVDAGPRSAGIRDRSQRKGQALAPELGTDHLDPIRIKNNDGKEVYHIDKYKTISYVVITYRKKMKLRCNCCPHTWEEKRTWESSR
jgi:hypothetical protein